MLFLPYKYLVCFELFSVLQHLRNQENQTMKIFNPIVWVGCFLMLSWRHLAEAQNGGTTSNKCENKSMKNLCQISKKVFYQYLYWIHTQKLCLNVKYRKRLLAETVSVFLFFNLAVTSNITQIKNKIELATTKNSDLKFFRPKKFPTQIILDPKFPT